MQDSSEDGSQCDPTFFTGEHIDHSTNKELLAAEPLQESVFVHATPLESSLDSRTAGIDELSDDSEPLDKPLLREGTASSQGEEDFTASPRAPVSPRLISTERSTEIDTDKSDTGKQNCNCP